MTTIIYIWTPQGNTTQSCAVCKKLKKRNKQLEKFNMELKEQLIELDKDYHQLQEAKTKIEGQLEILQDQLQQEEVERQNLTRFVPKLQEVITLIESNRRTAGTFGAQQTLKRINNLVYEQKGCEKNSTVMKRRHIRLHPSEASRDSMLSMFSDTSSIAESFNVDEEVTQSSSGNDTTALQTSPEKNRSSLDTSSKPGTVTSSLHRSKTQTQQIVKNADHVETSEAPLPTVTVTIKGQILKATPTHTQEQQDMTEPMKEVPQGHIRSESSPLTSEWSTKSQRSNTHPRNTRHRSASDIAGNSTKQGRSQSFNRSGRLQLREPTSPTGSGQAYLQSVELFTALDKRRKKLESQNEPCSTYQSQ